MKSSAGLSDFEVRDLNDKINKLLREKYAWEKRIIELGGPDYRRRVVQLIDKQGKEVPGAKGYKYFGKAQKLPGVKELFEAVAIEEAEEAVEAEKRKAKRTRADMYRAIDPDYFGYRDEEDGALLKYEKELERKLLRQIRGGDMNDDDDGEEMEGNEEVGGDNDDEEEEGGLGYIKREPVPTMKEIEQYLVQLRQKELMEKYL